MTPLELKEFLVELKSEHSEIKKTIVVADEADLSKFTGDIGSEDNMILVGVVPSMSHSGNIGSYKETPVFQIMVFEKTDYSAIDNDGYLELLQRTFLVMRKIRDYILGKVEEGCYPFFKSLSIDGLEIDAAKHILNLNGYSMDILTE